MEASSPDGCGSKGLPLVDKDREASYSSIEPGGGKMLVCCPMIS
jgi:hypothetical protein